MKPLDIRIINLRPDNEVTIHQAADLLVRGFQEHWPNAWPSTEAALLEVQESFQEDRISRIAVNESNNVLGWVGGIRQYRGNVWELHPLVVDPDYQGQGVGTALTKRVSEYLKEQGARVLVVWTLEADKPACHVYEKLGFKELARFVYYSMDCEEKGGKELAEGGKRV